MYCLVLVSHVKLCAFNNSRISPVKLMHQNNATNCQVTLKSWQGNISSCSMYTWT